MAPAVEALFLRRQRGRRRQGETEGRTASRTKRKLRRRLLTATMEGRGGGAPEWKP
jgi:hypothetical protein